MPYTAVDLFSGCGGLSKGVVNAGFEVVAAVEFDKYAAQAYDSNHGTTRMYNQDIRGIDTNEIRESLNGRQLHFLAGCPPCQGFSAVRRLNRSIAVEDERNNLILEYLRFIEELEPLTIMMENVPSIINYDLFGVVKDRLVELGYRLDYKIINVEDYGVPQRRKRFVMLGSRIGEIKVVDGTGEKRTVRDAIGDIESIENTADHVHRIYPRHKAKIQEMIERIPVDGGGRKDLPAEYTLECHKKEGIGFSDVYGRLKWDAVSSTITGGCLNPSKGRFLHPEEHRCITAREAALLQTFPIDYIFPASIPKTNIALMIGNALPPKFSQVQSEGVFTHLFDLGIE
ncbi:DNA cytosine methyltransferase [Saccharibacillus qingshengii]|uniref:DNA cytosine methyltransferase n=1 Tax=Saccharibacillus qingshengii TaxID=1763540 RepID=UPI0015521744|nr:DNA cytosine methyltransferase [Saccharibacillus qingshengii]